MRLSLVMVKLALVEVLQKYRFLVCEETEVRTLTDVIWLPFHDDFHFKSPSLLKYFRLQIPLEMDPYGVVGPINPIKLRVAKR